MPNIFHYERKELSSDVVLWELFGCPKIDEWNRFTDAAAHWWAEQESRGRRWGVVVDPSGMFDVSGSIRRAAGEWRAAHLPLLANTVICASYVADRPVMRAAVTAALWFAQPVVPVKLHGSREESVLWLSEKMRQISRKTAVTSLG